MLNLVALSHIAESFTRDFAPLGRNSPLTEGVGAQNLIVSKLTQCEIANLPKNFIPIYPQRFELSCAQTN